MTDTPIESGNAIIDGLFTLCVDILLWLADLFGISYEAINIWIFCVIWPILTIVLIVLVFHQRLSIRRLSRELKNRKGRSEPRNPLDEPKTPPSPSE